MKWDDIDQQVCSVARALSVLGERWTLLIIRDAFRGTRRFDDFQRSLGVTRHRLSERLGKLVDEGVLTRVAYMERPTRHEYRLTRKGLALYPVLMTLSQWGDDWMDDGDVIDGDTGAESDIRRLASWGLTGVVACLSGPVGLSMAAVNLMRGEDFRLNTHVLALTGFLVVSTSNGMVAQVVSALPI